MVSRHRIMDEDLGAVVVGLVLGILGPISLRLAYERRVILGRQSPWL